MRPPAAQGERVCGRGGEVYEGVRARARLCVRGCTSK